MKNLIRALAVSVLVLPLFASAQASSDIAAQAEALLAQILQLQQQLGLNSGAPSGPVAGTTSGGACYSGTQLKPGSRGAAVTELQNYLAADPSVYPEGTVSGYYGTLTQAAVGRWQAKNGIVSSGTPSTNGFGSVGPRTAAAMKASCGGGSTSNEPLVGAFMKVSPTNGMPPLMVSVEATINTVKSCLPATYTLNWGDGSQPVSILIPAGKCDVLAQTFTHNYTMGGQFEITLSSGEHKTTSLVTVSGDGMNMGTSGTFNTGTGGTTGTTGGTGGTNSSGTQTAGTLAISMGPNSFSPNSVTIPSGTRVTWTNTDSTSHTVTADNSSYNSGTLAPGKTYSLTFTARGEYTYFCGFHGGPGGVGMSGKIIVE